MQKIKISTFYRFSNIPAEGLTQWKSELERFAKKHSVRGLVILGEEGINTTFCGLEPDVEAMKKFFQSIPGFANLSFKDSYAEAPPFRRFKVQIRKEIVTLNRCDISDPNEEDTSHLSAEDWHKVLTSEKDYLLIDTRNWYETEIGKFKGAVVPDISEFTEFPKWLEENHVPKDKKILVYCTGGIRCEKGLPAMKSSGYQNVFQLKDGILRYLEKFPNGEFEGECFVFDHRVAVDQNLAPSTTFDLCPHCGQPAKDEIVCVKCDSTAKVCSKCLAKAKRYATCSKNCAHHYDLKPHTKIKPHTNHVSEYRKLKKKEQSSARSS
tara:strand:- start:6719 stop:7687 length:969 start_codon:yes stop_codon:yes gene_type:complete